MQVNQNLMIETIGVDRAADILSIYGLDLNDLAAKITAGCQWHETVEDVWWNMTAKQYALTDLYAVRWTETDEAGVADVEIVEITSDDPLEEAGELRDWLVEIAGDISGDGQTRDAEAYAEV